MDLLSLGILQTVAMEEGITRAADVLGRAPSNVTTRIQQLEAEIGVPLFHRDKKRMTLTSEGETFLDYARRILDLAEEAQQVVNPAGPMGKLRVGSMESTVATRLPSVLAKFNAEWPDVTIDLSTGPTRQLLEALQAHQVDCALVAIPDSKWLQDADQIDMVKVFREELVLLLPSGHPEIRSRDEIRPRALAAFALGCTYRQLAEDWLSENGSKAPRMQTHEVRSYHAMIACATAGSNVAILPRSVLDLFSGADSFTCVPITSVDTYLACRRGFATPAFTEFGYALNASSNV